MEGRTTVFEKIGVQVPIPIYQKKKCRKGYDSVTLQQENISKIRRQLQYLSEVSFVLETRYTGVLQYENYSRVGVNNYLGVTNLPEYVLSSL